ncbi:MAG: TnsD family transposase [Clostridiaceae bacterium]
MIHFFTDPYKDELIYSSIARYHFYSGNIDFKDTLEECFDKRTIVPSFEIGSPIDKLAKNIGGKYTADYLLEKHTVLPYYLPFLPAKRRREIIKKIKCGDCSGFYNQIGITAGSICKKDGIYYCPVCAKNEIYINGEAYIHREHQLQGIFLCPHHGELLKRYKIIKGSASRLEFIRLERQFLDFNSEYKTIKNYDLMLKLSKDAYYLLQTNLMKFDKNALLEKYKNFLNKKGLVTSGNRIKQRELYEEFISLYNEDLLNTMDSSIDNDDEYNWLRVITRNLKRIVHPIRHLLMINFLSVNIDEFFNDKSKKYNPFGDGPWPCLNVAANHYKNDVIKDLQITDDYKTRLPVGTFSCACGFIYSRKGPDKEISDRYKIGRIKNFGDVWENKLKGFLKEDKYGLRELARLMNCDPKTILKFDYVFGTNRFKNNDRYIIVKKTIKEANNATDKLTKCKNTILNNIEIRPATTRTEIRAICEKEYTFIYRNDKEWLKNNMPKETKKTNHQETVDWSKRDNEILSMLKNRYKEFINNNKSIRITKSSIGRALGILSELEKHIVKLHNTEKYLNEIIETVEEFQIRRCKKIINDKIDKGELIRIWEVQRIAGIRSEAFRKLKPYIIGYINYQYNRGINE